MILVWYAFLIALPSLVLKLASVIVHTRVGWLHCFLFGSAAIVLSICIRTVSILSGLALSASFGVALGVCIYLSIGSWFLSCRGLDREGKPVGFFGGMKVICVFLGILTILTISALVVARALSR
jgi:hypothetical protein